MFKRLQTLWRNLTQKKEVEEDLDAEIRVFHGMIEDEKVGAGVTRQEARRETVIETGGLEQIKEQVRDARLGVTIEAIWTELGQSLRVLRRNPGLSLCVVGILTLGMAASTLMFSIFESALLRPLPFRGADRVVGLVETRLDRGVDEADFSEANFWDVRTRGRSFAEVAGFHYDEANLTGDGPAEKVTMVAITSGFFRTLGVSPIIGRDFSYDEDRGWNKPGDWNGAAVTILGNRFWMNHFGGDRSILGKSVRLSDRLYTVVGVLPPGEPWIDRAFYVPFGFRPNPDRASWEYQVIARLKPGVSADAARADLQGIANQLAQEYPKDDKGIGFRMEASSEWVASDNSRRALWMLLGAVGFLMLIACMNIANLLLARGMARQKEIAVRTALGAGRARLVRFVMMEALVLSGIGAALGIALAAVALPAIQALAIPGIPRLADAGIDGWVLGFASLMAILTGVMSGLAPALQAPGGGIATALRASERQTANRGQGRLRVALVTAEVTLSFLLLVGAGLLMRSFTHLMSVNRGFQTENRLLFSLSMPGSYFEKSIAKQFLDRLLERLSADPQVIAAGAVSHRPIEGENPGMDIDRAAASSNKAAPWVAWRVISPGYFRAVGLPLIGGRAFDQGDKQVWQTPGEAIPVRRVILSARLAKRLFPNETAVGKHVLLWKSQSGLDAEVVGVVGDSRERGPASGPSLTVYLPYGGTAVTTEVVVHTRADPMALAPVVRSMVAEMDPNVPVADVRSFEEVVARSVAPQRFDAVLLGIFSGFALLLATMGVYAVLAYSVRRRASEIGLRMALGATRKDVLWMTIGQGLRPALAGIALGALGAWWLSRYMTTLLFGVKPFDISTYAAVMSVLLVTVVMACYLPCRRAMETDPAIALRGD